MRIGQDTPLSVQRNDPGSMLNLYRALLALRRQHAALAGGSISHVAAEGSVLSFRRSDHDDAFAIIANIGHLPVEVAPPTGQIVFSTLLDRTKNQVTGPLTLRGNEALILRI
jgi:alpha-glucosidase